MSAFPIVASALAKGVIMSVLLSTLNVAFIDQVIVAGVSATLTGLFLSLNTWYQVRELRRTQRATTEAKDEVKATIEAKLNGPNDK